MSESKVSCPHCSQSISLDTAWSGQVLNCPVCQKPFTVPQLEPAAPAGGGLRLNIPATPQPPAFAPGDSQRGTNATSQASRLSGLAIASLILSLLGCTAIAGVICGHLARNRMRRDASLSGGGLATAGLIIGYLVLALTIAGGLKFVLDVKHRVNEIQARRAGQSSPGSTGPVAASSGPTGARIRSSIPVPADAVSGTVKGEPFKFTRANFSQNVGSLEIDGREFATEGALIEIFFTLKRGESIENRTWHITATTAPSTAPTIILVRMNAGSSHQDRINGGYEMDVTTGAISGGVQSTAPGMPAKMGGTIAGTLSLKINGAAPVDIKGNFAAAVN